MHLDQMKKTGRRLLTAIILLICITGLYSNSWGVEKKTDYYDIQGLWSEKAVRTLIDKGIVQGVSVNGVLEIMPGKSISRVEFVSLAVRAFNLKPVASQVKTFKDVKKGAWYEEALRTATSNSLLAGYPDGGFHPGDPVTNEQVSIILSRLRNQQLKASGQSVESSWYTANVLVPLRKELKQMPTNAYVPKNNAARAEAMTAIYGFLKATESVAAKSPQTTSGAAPQVVGGNTGSGNDPASINSSGITATTGSSTAGSAGSTGSTTGSSTAGSAGGTTGSSTTGSTGGTTGSGTGTGSTGAVSQPAAAATGIIGYDIQAARGELVYYQIYAYALTGLGGFDFKITYDPKVVVASLVRSGSIKNGTYLKEDDMDTSQAGNGILFVKCRDDSAITASDGTLFTVVFRVQPEASGSTTISLKSSSGNAPVLYGPDGSILKQVTCSEGKITIK